MDRRRFLGAAAGALAVGATQSVFAGQTPPAPAPAPAGPPPARPAWSKKNAFKLKYAPHIGMFANAAGKDPLDQLRFMADQGFTAFEDNGMMGRPVELQQQMGDLMAKLGITMGVFVVLTGGNGNSGFTSGKPDDAATFVKQCETAVEVGKRVNAKWMTVVPGNFDRKLPLETQTAHVIDTLRGGADVLAKANMTMVLEPLSDTPDLFLRFSAQTYMICRAVNSPGCKILFDMYHMTKNEGSMIPHIDLAWKEIGYFQIGDNPGRKEPGTGEVNYKNVFKHIHGRMQAEKRDFVFGMEHGNSIPGVDGEKALIDAYLAADAF
ncbi:MAG: TIM barrel protein [Vicinamibacteraceae bacterium]